MKVLSYKILYYNTVYIYIICAYFASKDVFENGYSISARSGTYHLNHLQDKAASAGAKNRILELDTAEEIVSEMLSNPKSVSFSSYIYAHETEGVEAVMDFNDRLPSQAGIGLRHDSEFLDAFDHHILNMHQSGLVRKLMQKWIFKKPDDYSDRIFVEEADAIEPENLYFPASVLAVGVALGVIFSVGEKIKRRIS